MKKITIIALSIVFVAMFFNSCKKSEENVVVDKENVTSVVEVMNMFKTDDYEQQLTTYSTNFKNAALCHCLDIIFHQNESGELYPIKVTFDFGEENCEYPNGIFRRGKVHFTLTDEPMTVGAQMIIEFEDFYLNDVQLLGTKTITYTGLNESENPTWQTTIVNGGVIDTLGNQRTLNVTLNSEMVEGANTWGFEDNVVEVTGTATGSDNGISFSADITAPLRYEFGCWYPVSGEMQIAMGAAPIIVDFGEGECDHTAMMQIGDEEPVEINLCDYSFASF